MKSSPTNVALQRANGGLPLIRLCCALVALLVPTTASGSATPTAGAAAAPTVVNVTALPVEPTALAFYAKDRGFFRRQGIDARITVISDPMQAQAGVVSGTAQFSSFATALLAVNKSRGFPLRLVAAGALYKRKAPTTAIVAARGKRLTRARDLVGKTIALDAPNSPAYVGLAKWLKRNGLAIRDVRPVYLPFAQMVGPLSQGTVDAAVLPEPFLTQVLERGARRIAYPFHAVCARDCLLTVWIARRDINPNLAARFRNAIQAAAAWANRKRNERASGAILARYAGLDRALLRKVTRTRFATRMRLSRAKPWVDVYKEFGLLPESFRVGDLPKP